MANAETLNFFLADIQNVLLVKGEETENIVLIYEVCKKMACLLEEPDSPENFAMVAKLKDCGARIVSSEQLSDMLSSENDAPIQSAEQRRIARRLEERRKRKKTSCTPSRKEDEQSSGGDRKE